MKRSCKNLFVCAMLFLLIGFICSDISIAQSSSAEKLSSVLPDEVLAFIATSGTDELQPAFEKTILGQIWNDPGVQDFYSNIKESLLDHINQQIGGSSEQEVLNIAQKYAKIILSRPLVIGAAQKQTTEGPPVYGFAVLDAGPRKAEITSALQELEAMADEGEIIDVRIGSYTFHGPRDAGDVPGYWGWIDNYLVFAINDGEGLAIKYLQGEPPSRPTPNYLNKVPGNSDTLSVYLDPEKAIELVRGIARMEGGEEEFAIFEDIINELGLDKVKTITSRTGFDGSDIVVDELIEIPQPRTGLFANLKTIDMNMFDMVDAQAMSATAVNCDIAGVYDTVMKAVQAAAGEDFAEVEEAVAEIEKQLTFKIRDGLLESLDGRMVFYVLPGGVTAQLPQGGFVAIAGLEDINLWEDTMAALGKFATEQSSGMVQVSSQVQNGRTIHTWAVMPLAVAQVMPTWVISGDQVIIASNPAMCTLAIEQMNSRANSISRTAGFIQVTTNLPDNLLALKYSDSKVQFNQTMMSIQQFWPMATLAATNAGLKLPFMLPSLSHIAEKMGPSCQYSWFDEQGLRSHYRGIGVEQSIGAVAGGAIGLGVAMPALARARQQALRMVSGTNLAGIGKAMLIYANDYDDKFPPNLEELIEKCDLTPKVFESRRKPEDFDGPTYIYITGQNTSMYPGNILVYENPEYCTDGINVLFLDSHVQWMRPDAFLRDLEETYERLGREMPEIKFKNP